MVFFSQEVFSNANVSNITGGVDLAKIIRGTHSPIQRKGIRSGRPTPLLASRGRLPDSFFYVDVQENLRKETLYRGPTLGTRSRRPGGLNSLFSLTM